MLLQRGLCTKAKLSIFKPVYVPFLTYGHECWIMNEKVRSRVQATDMRFSRRISGLTFLDKVKSADIRESLNIESLLLRLQRSQLRWYGHGTQMSQERATKNCSIQKRLVEGLEAVPELDGEITSKILVGPTLAPHQSIYPLSQRIEMLGCSNSSSCPRDPTTISNSRKVS